MWSGGAMVINAANATRNRRAFVSSIARAGAQGRDRAAGPVRGGAAGGRCRRPDASRLCTGIMDTCKPGLGWGGGGRIPGILLASHFSTDTPLLVPPIGQLARVEHWRSRHSQPASPPLYDDRAGEFWCCRGGCRTRTPAVTRVRPGQANRRAPARARPKGRFHRI